MPHAETPQSNHNLRKTAMMLAAGATLGGAAVHAMNQDEPRAVAPVTFEDARPAVTPEVPKTTALPNKIIVRYTESGEPTMSNAEEAPSATETPDQSAPNSSNTKPSSDSDEEKPSKRKDGEDPSKNDGSKNSKPNKTSPNANAAPTPTAAEGNKEPTAEGAAIRARAEFLNPATKTRNYINGEVDVFSEDINAPGQTIPSPSYIVDKLANSVVFIGFKKGEPNDIYTHVSQIVPDETGALVLADMPTVFKKSGVATPPAISVAAGKLTPAGDHFTTEDGAAFAYSPNAISEEGADIEEDEYDPVIKDGNLTLQLVPNTPITPGALPSATGEGDVE